MNKLPAILIGVISLIYIGLRLWGLTDSCHWFDEIFGVHAAEHGWDTILRFIAQDLIHPPLFYLLLKVWISFVGSDLFWLRLFPFIFSILAVVPFLQLCRELKLKIPTVAAAFALFAVNGALIKYAQEVRMYSLFLFLSLMSMWLFARFFIKGKSFVLLIIVNVLIVYTHYFGWLVILSELTAILIFQRIKVRQTLLMVGITMVSFAPWLFAVYRAAMSGSQLGQNIGWIERPGLSAIFVFVFDVIEPFYFQASSTEPSTILWITLPMLIIIGVAKLIYYADLAELEGKEAFYLLAFFCGLPLTFALAASWLMPYSVWGTRHLIIVFAPMLILSAIFLTGIKSKNIMAAALIAIAGLTSIAFVQEFRRGDPQYIWCSWEDLSREMTAAPDTLSGPKRLYVYEDLVAYHFWFSTRNESNVEVHLIKNVDGVHNDPAYFLPRGFDSVTVSEFNEVSSDEIWVAFRETNAANNSEENIAEKRFEVPVTNLQERGYSINNIWRKVIGSNSAYLIQMKKAR